MTTQTLDAFNTEPRRAGTHPAVTGVASALLLWASFPPAAWSWLAWVALVPLFLLVRSDRSHWAIYSGATLGGLAFWMLSIQWVRLTEPGTAWLAWVAMASFLALWWPAFLLLARIAVRRLGLPLMLAAPIVWVALEFVRAFILTGFPWYYLAHSQYLTLSLIQIADFAGALGLSFLVAMVNACGADLLSQPLLQPTPRGPRLARAQVLRLSIVVLGLAATLGYGTYRLSTARFRPGPRLALMQSNIEQVLKNKNNTAEKILAVYRGLVERVVRMPERPDLIVWPETSWPYGFVTLDARLETAALERQIKSLDAEGTIDLWRRKMADVTEHLQGWVNRIEIPMLVGSITYDFHRKGLSRFNSAILFVPGSVAIQTYHKLHLVPFGEYVPLIDALPWLVALTPYRGTDHVPGLAFGSEPTWFDLKGFRIATPICFEDTVPHVVRRFFTDVKDGRRPDMLINLSNDGWFHGSEELDMHLAVSVFRAVENRVAMARAVNTGISAFIDGNGQIVSRLQKNTEGVLAGIAMLDDRVSLYTSWGDWLGQFCLAICIGLVPMALGQTVYARWHAEREIH